MCDYILTRGKNKGTLCGRNIKRGHDSKCTQHVNKEVLHQCKHVGVRNGVRCTRFTTLDNDYCQKCMTNLKNKQDTQDYRQHCAQLKKKQAELMREQFLAYQQYATEVLYETLDCQKESDTFEMIEYIENALIKDDGNVLEGPCKAIDENDTTKVIAMRSDMDTGKTYQVYKYIQNNLDKKILVVTCKKSLANDLKSKLMKLDFTMYLDSVDMKEAKHLIIQAESLHRLKLEYDILILDEAFSLATQMFSMDTQKVNITVNHQTFLHQLNVCKKVILLDACFIRPVLDFYSELCGEKIKVYSNAYKNPNKPRISFYSGSLHSYAKLIYYDLKRGKKVVFATNNKKQGEKVLNYVKCYFGVDMPKYVYYNSDTPFPSHVKEDGTLYNVREDFVKYDFLIYSPTICQGVDFNVEHFDVMYAYYANNTTNSFEFKQLLGRIRYLNDNEIKIFTRNVISTQYYWDLEKNEPKQEFENLQLKSIVKHYKMRDNVTCKFLKIFLDTNVSMEKDVNDYIQYVYNFEKNTFKKYFLIFKYIDTLSEAGGDVFLRALLLHDGYSIGPDSILKSDEESEKLDTFDDEERKKMVMNVCKNTPSITSDEYYEIKEKTKNGLVDLRVDQITKTNDVRKQEFLMKVELAKLRKYQFEVLNEYRLPDKSYDDENRNDIIPTELFTSIMMNEIQNVKFVKNSLFDKSVDTFCEKTNVSRGELFKSILHKQIKYGIHNPDVKINIVKWQRKICILNILNKEGYNIIKDGYTSEIIQNTKMMKQIFSAWNKFKDILMTNSFKFLQNSDPRNDNLKNFNTIINNVVQYWSGHKLKHTRSTKDGKRITYYEFEEPFEGFDYYIECCKNSDKLIELLNDYNEYKTIEDENFQRLDTDFEDHDGTSFWDDVTEIHGLF